MDKPIIEAKGSGKALIIVGLAMFIIAGAIPIILAQMGAPIMKGEDMTEDLLLFVPFLGMMALGGFLISHGAKYGKCKLNVFEDYIEGSGVVKGVVREFNLKYDKISDVTKNKGVLDILSSGEKYELSLNEEEALKIFGFIKNKI